MRTEEPEEYISFLSNKVPTDVKAPAALWIAAAVTFLIHLGISLSVANVRGKDGAGLVGTILGACFWPIAITALSSRWNKTQKGKVKVFFFTSLGLVLLSITTFLAVSGYVNFVNR